MAAKMDKKISQLMEMGASRAAARSALKACKEDIDEAAVVVFEDVHANAAGIESDEEQPPRLDRSRADKGKQPARLPTPADEEDQGDDELEEGDELDEDMGMQEDDNESMMDYPEDEDAVYVDGDGDAYGFLDVSRDRKETVREVEEPTRKVWIACKQRGDQPSASSNAEGEEVEAEIFGLQRWLSGCPEGNEQQQLFPLYNTLAGNDFSSTKCPHGCGQVIERHESDFFAVPAEFEQYLKRTRKIVQISCSRCSKGICLACGGSCRLAGLPVDSKGKGKAADINQNGDDDDKAPSDDVLLHCPEMQAIILGVGLYIAQKVWDEAEVADSSTTANPKKRKGTPSESESASHGTSTPTSAMYTSGRPDRNHNKSGIGYGGERGKENTAGQQAALKLQQEKDARLASLLAQVRTFLPNRERQGPFRNSDHMPAGQTLAHLRRRFNPMASHLLSAESLSDMSDRTELYTEFMAWLGVMSAHENLAGLMGQPIMKPSSVTYTEVKVATGMSTLRGREKIIVFEANPGPRELLERILAQVRVAKRVLDSAKTREEAALAAAGLSGMAVDESQSSPYAAGIGKSAQASKEAKRLVDFCETIVKAVDSIDRALRQSKKGDAVLKGLGVQPISAARPEGEISGNTDKEDLSTISEEELRTRYETWAKSAVYDHYDWSMPGVVDPLTGPDFKNYYSKEAKLIASYPARNTALMKEHTGLSSSLPAHWGSSVFLKTDENRPDVIKALIIGPDNTPYENGCFLFDILLGATFNQTPPSVKSMTTKGGKYRLNPNLYAEGKVCLSLLGTWAGPGWIPGKSTLLQVLLSIQSMILCSEPIGNEPGFERDLGTPRSKAYNANVRRMVVHIAMLDYLKIEAPEGFEEVIDTHFRLKARSIRAQLDNWAQEDDKLALAHDSMTVIGAHRNSKAAEGAGPGVAGTVGSGSGSAFVKEISEVKKLLHKLEKGQAIRVKHTATEA